ncbi:MAG TPA: hypothetical protein VHM19_05860 [Polyangiales bacterium]|jgi:hypothetical protein|nr:hypothetical protein [Polyangiales bacterium]
MDALRRKLEVDRQAAEAKLRAAQSDFQELEQELVRLRSELSQLREQGAKATTSEELARVGAWSARLAEQRTAAAERLRQVQASLTERTRDVQRAELALRSAYVDQAVLARFQERSDAQERKLSERAEQDEIDEANRQEGAKTRSRDEN